jgi:hypothetical protein
MLRKHERRSLDEIEKRLAEEEPELARDFAESEVPARFRLNSLSNVLVSATTALVVLCLLLGEPGAALLAGVLVAALVGSRRWTWQA